jgi:hypothetical protein
MSDLKLPVALVLAMAVQLVAAVWWVSKQAHAIATLQSEVTELRTYVNTMDLDVQDLVTFATFTENRWAEAYMDDLTYNRLFGTKEPVIIESE